MSTKSTISYCQRCDYKTNHVIITSGTQYSSDPDYDYRQNYYIVSCAGCSEFSVKKESIDFENAYPDEDGSWVPETQTEYYPKKKQLSEESYYHRHIPRKIRTVLLETIKSVNTECYLLAGAGYRATIEAICLKEQIKGRTLQNKIDNLTKNRLITDKESARLHSIRFLGNDSIHEMTVPSKKKILLVHSIIENLLNNLYVIDNESRDHLETIIDKFEVFERLLKGKMESYSGDKTIEVPLAKIIGKDTRRFNGKISAFESELKQKIRDNSIEGLVIGKIDFYGDRKTKKVQHYRMT